MCYENFRNPALCPTTSPYLLGDAHKRWFAHQLGDIPHKRAISLHHDPFTLAIRPDLALLTPRVHLQLVHSGLLKPRSGELFQMTNTKVRYADGFDDARISLLKKSTVCLDAPSFTGLGRVDQEEVDVVEACGGKGTVDGGEGGGVALVCVEDLGGYRSCLVM